MKQENLYYKFKIRESELLNAKLYDFEKFKFKKITVLQKSSFFLVKAVRNYLDKLHRKKGHLSQNDFPSKK